MGARSDIVIIGSGHNGLIAAAYCALAGLSVTVLAEQEIPGGATVTEEIDGAWIPAGYVRQHPHNPAAQPDPCRDELGLIADGRYAKPDPIMVVHTADGESVTMSPDAGATAAELARFSTRDAASFRHLVAEWEEVLETYLQVVDSAPDSARASSQAGAKLATLSRTTAAQIIADRFEDEPRERKARMKLHAAGMIAP